MLLTDVEADQSARATEVTPRQSDLGIGISAVTKTVLATAAGFVLSCGVGLLLWAVTPSSGNAPSALVRAGVAAFCAAAGMTLQIGTAHLTLPPLMLTAVIVALLCAVVGRGYRPERGTKQELIFVAVSAVTFAVAVTVVGVTVGGSVVSAAQWWHPGFLALIVVGTAMLVRGTASRAWIFDRSPGWVPVSLRLCSVGVLCLFGGGAVTLVIGLIRTFSDAGTVQSLAAPGAAGGFGMLLLGVAYLPNAAIAATGYSMGVGFTVGSGTYTPFGSSPVELPAVSLLAAVPDAHVVSRTALLVLLVPVTAGLLMGIGAVRRLTLRSERLFAVGGASLLAALVAGVLAEVASGGVSGGEWESSGVPPFLFGAIVGVALGAVSAGVVALARATQPALSDLEDDRGQVRSIDTTRDEPDDTDEVLASDDELGNEVIDDCSAVDEPGYDDAAVDVPGNDDSAGDEPGGGAAIGGESGDALLGVAEIIEDGGSEGSLDDGEQAAGERTAETEPVAIDGAEETTELSREEDLIATDGTDPDQALVMDLPARGRPSRTRRAV